MPEAKPAVAPNPACIRCWEAKTKCERTFPCRRCVTQGFECLPHLSKKQLINTPIDQSARTDFRPIFAKMVQDSMLRGGSGANEDIKRLLRFKWSRSRFLANPHWVKTVEFVIHACGFALEEICPPFEQKSRAEAAQMMTKFESWVPQQFHQARDATFLPGVCTVFHASCYGHHHYECNDKFQETFGSSEEMAVDLIGREIPDISHRIVAQCDREAYTKDVFSAAGTDEGRKLWENTNTFSLEGVYHCVNKQGKKLLTYVHRQGWLHDNGYQQAWFGTFRVLPDSRHRVREQVTVPAKRAKTAKTAAAKPRPAPAAAKPTAIATPLQDTAVPICSNDPPAAQSANVTSQENQLDATWGAPLPAAAMQSPLLSSKEQENLSDLITSLLDDPLFFDSLT